MPKTKLMLVRWRNSPWQRFIIGGIVGAGITVLFAIFNGVFGLLYQSLWYGVFAGYYLVLAAQKLSLLSVYGAVRHKFGDDQVRLIREKQKIYLINGAILVPVAIALGVIVAVLVRSPKPTAYDEIMAITAATYAFYKITMAIINLVKAKRRHDDLIRQTLRNLALVEALVSIIILESTLITTFGDLDAAMQMIIAISGVVVGAFIIGLGSWMIINGVKQLRMPAR